jgi:putative hydrolase of the HAD superfamily
MQADKLSERDYWLQRTREVGLLVGERWDAMETLVQRARGADPEAVMRPEAVQAIHAAKAAGFKLAVLSNELDLFYGAAFRAKLPLLDIFDVIVDATYTGILKPDPRAYAECQSQLGVEAHHCVFVDDQLRNIDGARRVGWQTVHFDVMQPAKSYQQALTMLGVELP